MRLVVHINGWPGTGKLTIARLLASCINGRLLDNHTLLNPAERLFQREDPLWQTLRSSVRALVFSHAVKVENGVPIVLTDALADDPCDQTLFDDCRRLAEARHARLVAVLMHCELGENIRRLTADGRSDMLKLTSVETLAGLRAVYRLLRPLDVELLELDVTRLSAEQACADLYARLQ